MQPEAASDAPDAAQAAPTIVVGGSAGDIVALRAEDGMIRWIYPTPPGWPSLVSSGEVIYLGTYLPSQVNRLQRAQVTALRVRDGTVVWRASPKGLHGPTALAVDGDTVFAVAGGLNRAVFALDTQTGAVRWITPDMRGCGFRLRAGWNALSHWAALSEYFHLSQTRGTYRLLTAQGGAVYLDANTSSGVHALDARTGRERWRSGRRSTPRSVTASDTHLYAEIDTPQGWLIAVLRATDGTTEHTLPLQQGRERPLLLTEQGIVYLMCGHQLCAVRIRDGQPVWCSAQVWEETSLQSDVALRVCLSDQALSYCRVQLVPKRLRVGALDRQTGKKLWEWNRDEDLAQASNAVSLVGGHGQLYVATRQGLFAFRERDGQMLWHALPTTDLSFIQPALVPTESGG